MNIIKAYLSLLILALLSSCANVHSVAKNWGNQLREYQIIPIFPPREDVYVGDVYIVETHNEKEKGENKDKFLSFGTLATYINLQDETATFYRNRPNFPKTELTEPESGNEKVARDTDSNKLKNVIFPNFLSSSAKESGLTASIPGQTLAAALGVSAKDFESASISIPQAESYAIPAKIAYSKLQTECNDPSFKAVIKDKEILLVSEVYYTRQMNITIDRKSTSGAKGEVAITVDPSKLGKLISDLKSSINSSTQSPKTVGSQQNSTVESTQPPKETTDSNSIISIKKKQLEEVLSSLEQTKNDLDKSVNEANLPGIGFWNVQSKGLQIFVNGVFKKPIAIGFRGLKINSDCSLAALPNETETPFKSSDIGTDSPELPKVK